MVFGFKQTATFKVVILRLLKFVFFPGIFPQTCFNKVSFMMWNAGIKNAVWANSVEGFTVVIHLQTMFMLFSPDVPNGST